MIRLRSHIIGIEQGEVVLFSDYEHDGVMWTGNGPRQTRAYVQFSEVFSDVPSVRVALTMWDMSSETNARADVSSQDATVAGFSILFRTWGDTRVARVRVGWQAIGPLPDADQWVLE